MFSAVSRLRTRVLWAAASLRQGPARCIMDVEYVILVVCVVTLLLLVAVIFTLVVVWRRIRRNRAISRSRGVSQCHSTIRKIDVQCEEVHVKRLSRQTTGNSAGEPDGALSIGNDMDPQPRINGGAPLVLIVPNAPQPREVRA